MLTFDEAAKRWAAMRLEIDPATIESVSFDVTTGGFADPDGYPMIEVFVRQTDGTSAYVREGYCDGIHDAERLLREFHAIVAGVEDVTQ